MDRTWLRKFKIENCVPTSFVTTKLCIRIHLSLNRHWKRHIIRFPIIDVVRPLLQAPWGSQRKVQRRIWVTYSPNCCLNPAARSYWTNSHIDQIVSCVHTLRGPRKVRSTSGLALSDVPLYGYMWLLVNMSMGTGYVYIVVVNIPIECAIRSTDRILTLFYQVLTLLGSSGLVVFCYKSQQSEPQYRIWALRYWNLRWSLVENSQYLSP